MTKAVAQLAPQLKAAGFRRFRTDFNKQPETGLIHVIGFQGRKWGDSFTINLGVYVREIDQLFDDWWGRSKKAGVPGEDGPVKEYDCWLRARLGDIRFGGHDVWWDYVDLDAAVADIASRLNRDAVPAFGEVSTRDALLEWWRDRERRQFRWSMEPRTPLGFALLMKQAGAVDEARSIVEDVCNRTRGVPFHNLVSVLAEEMGFECSDS
jgi:hypothetical protein